MTDEKWPQSDVKYDPTQNDLDETRWQNTITTCLSAGTLRLDPTDNTHRFILRGDCPRCGHDIGERELNFRRLGFNAAEADGAERPSFNIVCLCTRPHKTRPKAESGCGWSSYSTVYIDSPRGGDGA